MFQSRGLIYIFRNKIILVALLYYKLYHHIKIIFKITAMFWLSWIFSSISFQENCNCNIFQWSLYITLFHTALCQKTFPILEEYKIQMYYKMNANEHLSFFVFECFVIKPFYFYCWKLYCWSELLIINLLVICQRLEDELYKCDILYIGYAMLSHL